MAPLSITLRWLPIERWGIGPWNMSKGIVGTDEYECATTSSATITAVAVACSVPSEDAARESPNIGVRGLLYGCGFVGNAGAVVSVNIKGADIATGTARMRVPRGGGWAWRWLERLRRESGPLTLSLALDVGFGCQCVFTDNGALPRVRVLLPCPFLPSVIAITPARAWLGHGPVSLPFLAQVL